VGIKIRARLDHAGLQDDLDIPAPVVPRRPDRRIKPDRAGQFLISVPVQRAKPGMPEDGSPPVNHQSIIPGSMTMHSNAAGLGIADARGNCESAPDAGYGT
jgi:hypothetical protein